MKRVIFNNDQMVLLKISSAITLSGFLAKNYMGEVLKVLVPFQPCVAMAGVQLQSVSSQSITSLISMAGETQQVGAESQTGLGEFWKMLEPFKDELMAGADIVCTIALIYTGFLFLMGQSSKGKKIFKNALGGYFLIRLSPIIINIISKFGSVLK